MMKANWCYIRRVYPDRPMYVLMSWFDCHANYVCTISVGLN